MRRALANVGGYTWGFPIHFEVDAHQSQVDPLSSVVYPEPETLIQLLERVHTPPSVLISFAPTLGRRHKYSVQLPIVGPAVRTSTLFRYIYNVMYWHHST